MKNIEGVDGRKKPARRWHVLFSEFLNTRGPLQGRHDTMTRAAAKRGATLTLFLEKMDRDLLNGVYVNPESYARTSSALERVLTQLGVLEPEPEKKPTLNDLLNKKEQPKNGQS